MLFEDNARVFRDTLGPDHPMVAASLRSLALSLRARGDLAGAETRTREAALIVRRTFGQSTSETLLQLADIVRAEGRSEEADDLAREAEEIGRQADRRDP